MALNRRSQLITQGVARSPNRAMLRAVGFGDDDFVKPIVGVANGHSNMNPCNAGIQPLVERAMAALREAGAMPQVFGVPTITDGIGMGTEAMKYSLVSREVIADAIETAVNGQAMDGVLVCGGCDKNMKRRHILAMITSLTLVAALSACGKKEQGATPKTEAANAPQDQTVVRIGSASPLTGPQAHIGTDIRNGVQLAIEDANAAGVEIGGKKVRFELLAEDDEANPTKATTVAQKLVDSKVVAVVGHFNSGASIPASKIYSDAGIPQISPGSTNPKYTEQGFKTTFRVVTHDNQQGPTIARFSLNNLKAKSIAVIDDSTAYGQGLADAFEKTAKAGGAEIVAREHTTDKDTDFKAILTKIKGRNPDLIMRIDSVRPPDCSPNSVPRS